MRRLVCLHGHFYQPPRENPWIEEVEVQDSAAPFHDWNARITAECYGPNGAARLKNHAGRITDIVNNYLHLSFNFGPTLLAWMEREAPEAYQRVLEADARSVAGRGHGNAIAQGYNHAILPLCSPRDLRTQVIWGLRDFRHRFGRDAEGFWLPETAADTKTLAVLADHGVRFTVLSPYQALRVRGPGETRWQEATGARFDPTRPYKVALGGGRSMAVFFYDAPIARSLAFGEGLSHGDELVRRLESGFSEARGHDELLTVAVDGETFGHHKKGGDEVLAAALRALHARKDVELVNLGQALERLPLEWEAEIVEGASWSCAHGLERWRSDCGCEANGRAGWNQKWRAPLRDALDELRDALAAIYEREAGKLLRDPWQARDEFIELVLDPERSQAAAWLDARASVRLTEESRATALRLLEMQRQAMLMYTSCGWFFSELSGLETVQILKYGARALQLALEVTGIDLEPAFRKALSRAQSNLPELGDGARIYDSFVKPSVVSQEGVAAHYAIASLFEGDGGDSRIFCYRASVKERRRETTGQATLSVMHLELQSLVTRTRLDLSACVLHLSGSDFRCGLMPYEGPLRQAEIEQMLFSVAGRLSLAQLVREVDRIFPGRDYSLRDLFIDERRKLAAVLLGETLRKYERDYFEIYESNRRLMEFLREIDSPVPGPLRVAAAMALSQKLTDELLAVQAGRSDIASARAETTRLLSLGHRLQASLDLAPARDTLQALLRARMTALLRTGAEAAARDLVALVDLGHALSLPLDLWAEQNTLWANARESCATLPDDLLSALAERLWLEEAALRERRQGERRVVPRADARGLARAS